MKNTPIKMAWVGLIVAPLTLISAQAVILHPAHGELTREDIEQASHDLGALFPCVGQGVGDMDGALYGAGSVVAITDEIAISAKHATFIFPNDVNPGRVGEPFDALYVVFGENSKDEVHAGRLHTPIAVHRHETLDFLIYEFAVGELADVPKATLFEGEFAPEYNDILIHVGMDYYAHVGDSETVWDGYRRACYALVNSHPAYPANCIVTHF